MHNVEDQYKVISLVAFPRTQDNEENCIPLQQIHASVTDRESGSTFASADIFNVDQINESGSSSAAAVDEAGMSKGCLLYTSPSPRDRTRSRMPSSA